MHIYCSIINFVNIFLLILIFILSEDKPLTLFVDSGSTKSEWIVMDTKGAIVFEIKTEGINPAIHSLDYITLTIQDTIKKFPFTNSPLYVNFYGAGCNTDYAIDLISSAFSFLPEGSSIKVESDMAAAAFALYGDGEGIACILGTGSNSCHWKAGKVIDQVPSLGFILGDEGSGSALGKRLLNGIFKRQLSDEITDLFFKAYPLSVADIIQKVYKNESPNRFLAQFTHFLKDNIDKIEIRNLVKGEFMNFIHKNILPYSPSSGLSIGFVGSVAFHFEDILKETLTGFPFQISKILKSPLEGIKFNFSHVKN